MILADQHLMVFGVTKTVGDLSDRERYQITRETLEKVQWNNETLQKKISLFLKNIFPH